MCSSSAPLARKQKALDYVITQLSNDACFSLSLMFWYVFVK